MRATAQLALVDDWVPRSRPAGQLLKWVGNKFRYAEAIAAQLPSAVRTYFEPFVGTGAVVATIGPDRAVAGDVLPCLIEFFRLVQDNPESLLRHYEQWSAEIDRDGREAYESVRARFNEDANPHDLLVISRTCYAGVIRFTREGKISTPLGPHRPMNARKLETYMREWRVRLAGTSFVCAAFEETMERAGRGDVIYCDPPYVHGQRILYGAQDFELTRLWHAVEQAVARNAKVAVSVDGFRQSGRQQVDVDFPDGLFRREMLIHRGGCMLRRLQLAGADTTQERVADRLLLTW